MRVEVCRSIPDAAVRHGPLFDILDVGKFRGRNGSVGDVIPPKRFDADFAFIIAA